MNILLAVIIALVAILLPSALYAQDINTLLTTADAAAGGEIASHRCAICHTFDKDGANKIGPNLWDIVGSFRAHAPNFNYSDALKSMHHEKWSYDALNLYLANPHKFAPGDKMAFPGIADEKQRADLIAWLRLQSNHPLSLPEK